ncbi:MAG TPA: AAA family ATPase [Gemmataceae bacterium]|nr:AAA family ATPase [Gemmataceae bacterium]
MYEDHFGLRQRPFRATPDSDSYYPATTHEHAVARLMRALGEDEGLMLVTGEPGTGKTLLCHRLLARMGADITTVFLTNSHFRDRTALFQAILYDLSLPYAGLSEQECRLSLTEFLLRNYAEGRRTLILIDEAQHLTPDLLEELRLLGNLEARQGKAVQIILVAQPALLETICRTELAALAQRLIVRLRLEALSIDEAADYLIHHLRAAGGKPDRIIDEEALTLLARSSRGIARVLNQAAHQALSLAYEAGTSTVDAEAALEVMGLMGIDADRDESELEPARQSA